jgi:hypothetical protein
VVTAVYILNYSPTKALNGRTPYEAWHGRKPAVSLLRVFGCLTFGKELGHIGKLDDRSTPGVFIGYAEGSKVYHILDPGTQRVRTTRDVLFDEGRGWTWDKVVDDGSTPTYDNFTIEYIDFDGARGVGSSLPPSMSTPVPKPPPTSALRCPATTSAATMSSPPPPQPVPQALQQRRPPLRACLLHHQLTSSPARWSSLPRSLSTRSASTRATTVSRCGTVRWRTFSATSQCRD